jgi:radical SAM family uncharacterized protein
MNTPRIDPPTDLRRILARVQNPGRYAGGEFGAIEHAGRDADGDYLVALSFPDLYEIGMSNTAIKLLYTLLNALQGVRCERVFAPAPDFEAELTRADIPLYTLESGIPLSACDMVAFSVGYELSATNILTILECGGVPIRASQRAGDDPVVIAGGPISMNPVPFGRFFDGVFVGEAEGEIERMVAELAQLKAAGKPREAAVEHLHESAHVWWPGAQKRVGRAIWTDFGQDAFLQKAPVPNIRVVQDHGVVEIMRGCPQGCRFCSAGVFYRPVRMKDYRAIEREVENLVYGHGYRHITLSSLSTGDYADVQALFGYLNARFAEERVSFALPSLRVNSFTLPLLAEVSQVRKSGLTFAVETPGEAGQLAINKRVPLDRTREILLSAREQGWRLAKFYFMIGLPVPEADEVTAIAEFMGELKRSVKMNFNVAVATFVPKPHTPFQWARRLGEYEALDRLMELKRALKRQGIKFSYQSPFQSVLEGILSRGDERVGELIEAAHRRGCRLDAWEEYLDTEVWRAVTGNAGWPVEEELFRERDTREQLPWQVVTTGVGTGVLRQEWERAQRGELTEACGPDCDHPCGVCGTDVHIRQAEPAPPPESAPSTEQPRGSGSGTRPLARHRVAGAAEGEAQTAGDDVRRRRVLFEFSKTGRAIYTPHLGLMGVFERAYRRAGVPVEYTGGFNPKPRQEFAQPLSLGIASEAEIAMVAVTNSVQPKEFCEVVTAALPPGVEVKRALSLEEGDENLPSLMSRYWGSTFTIDLSDAASEVGRRVGGLLQEGPGVRNVAAAEGGDKGASLAEASVLEVCIAHEGGQARGLGKLLKTGLEADPAAFGIFLRRTATHAIGPDGEPASYFMVYAPEPVGS